MTAEAPAPDLLSKRRIAPRGWALVAVRLFALLLLLTLCIPAYYALAPVTRHNPVPRLFLRTVGTICGLRIRKLGALPVPGSFFIANHVSWLDIPALAGATGTAFVAHDGLAGFGPLRWLCELNDTVFIARHQRATVSIQIEQIRAAMHETGALAVFPEGTTSGGVELLPFKSSLLSAIEGHDRHVAVQPVWLDYGPEAREIAWVGDEPGIDNALHILARWRPIPLTLHFLPPLTGEERTNRKTMAHGARRAIARAMGLDPD
ncbi:1-acyl-sn-glycerol-3-phosphate acyltransferase [Novosphingobium sp. ST904]|nr:1-acyl-sn-glycerol-3-phosphate acyltransferase [Novosphingobium sp. ST904]